MPDLVIAFSDVDPFVRAWAAQAVGYIGPRAAGAVPALIELLNGDAASRGSACMALGEIGAAAESALPALRAALTDPDESVRRFAVEAIQRIQQK